MHSLAKRNAQRFLSFADRMFGERLVGFYIVGSAALGDFRPDRSDIDFIAVLDPSVRGDCWRARAAQLVSGARTGVPALLRGRTALPGTCNGVYLSAEQLQRPVSQITPIASHNGIAFECGSGFDVNPVVWKTFADHGIALRGPEPSELGLDPEPHLLRQWNLDNLNSYWRRYATSLMSGSHTELLAATPPLPRHGGTSAGLKGEPRNAARMGCAHRVRPARSPLGEPSQTD